MNISLIFSAASLILCAFFFVYFRAYLRRRTGPDRLLAEFREEVYKLIAEIDAATDKDSLLVEERIKSLRTILADVDKRISIQVRELDRQRFQEDAYAQLGKRYASTKADGFAPVYDEMPHGPRIVSREITLKPLPFAEQVAELSRAGFSANLIATRLGVSISEVELAIAIASDQ
ncbi:MAG: hypothetical protein LBU17_05255 [Treponema sp.]|jgi:hypothetical protein|nr:hypothetical protein [Treponema sp.]